MNRPDKEGAREIYRIYLTNDLPYDGALAKEADNIGAAIDELIERFVEWQFARRDENKFLEVTLRSGRKEMLYRSDLISGAIIASVVERAKEWRSSGRSQTQKARSRAKRKRSRDPP